jgi:23S rRNA pseudouridine955/2504/2580 synthase
MLSLLYQDGEILVLDKPSGLATQPGAGIKISLVEAVERDFGFRPFLVHRLDRETAGCIIVARDSRAAAKWTDLIAGRELRKFYRAVVAGRPRGEAGLLSTSVRVRGVDMNAETKWSLLGCFGGGDAGGEAQARPRFSLLELELGTGRTHQIRVQLAEAGLPILGDDAHGDFKLNKELKRSFGLKRLLLLSRRLVLPGGRTVIEAPLPEHFRAFFSAFADLDQGLLE